MMLRRTTSPFLYSFKIFQKDLTVWTHECFALLWLVFEYQLHLSTSYWNSLQIDITLLSRHLVLPSRIKFKSELIKENHYRRSFGSSTRSEERRVGKECRSRWSP